MHSVMIHHCEIMPVNLVTTEHILEGIELANAKLSMSKRELIFLFQMCSFLESILC